VEPLPEPDDATVELLDDDEPVVVTGAGLQLSPGPQGLAEGSQASPSAARWQMLPPSPADTHANWVPAVASPQQSAAVVQASPSPLQVGRCEVVHTPLLQVSAPQQVPPELQSSPNARQTEVLLQLARQKPEVQVRLLPQPTVPSHASPSWLGSRQ